MEKKTKVTMIREGLWELLHVGKNYRYRILTHAKVGGPWDIYRLRRDASKDVHEKWELADSGYKTRIQAAEVCVEMTVNDDFETLDPPVVEVKPVVNPVSDTLSNIDDIDDDKDLDERRDY